MTILEWMKDAGHGIKIIVGPPERANQKTVSRASMLKHSREKGGSGSMAQPSKTGRMISAHDLAYRIASDAERYEVSLGVTPFITMSSGARKLLEEDPETSGWFYVDAGCRGFCGYFVITDPSDKVWYQIGRRQLFEEEEQ